MPFDVAVRVLALCAVFAGAGAARAQSDTASFDFSVAGIPLGEVQVSSEQQGGTYSAASRISTTGLMGAFADFGFDGQATGRLTGSGAIVPERFVARSKSPRADRHTEIDWQDGTPTRVSVEPPRKSAPDPAAQAGTLDPVSAGFAILRDNQLERICDTSIIVFDGSRRSRLTLGKAEPQDGDYVCTGSYARLEGEAHSLSNQQEYPFQIVFRPSGDGMVELDRIETRTRFGLAVAARRG